MTDKNKEALDFIWKHAKGILCECGKEDAPCLGCTAIKTIRTALENAPELVTCLWVHDETSEIFETSCAHSFHFVAGEIKENGFVFCPYCGNKIVREK